MARPKITGTIAILTRSNGAVVATAVDTGTSKDGSPTVEDAQRYRARIALATSMLRVFCAPEIVRLMGAYESGKLLDSLCLLEGFQVSFDRFGDDMVEAV